MDKGQKFSVWFFLGALIFAWLFAEYIYKPYAEKQGEVPYSEFLADLDASNVEKVDITEGRITYAVKETTSPDKRPIVGGVILSNKKIKRQKTSRALCGLQIRF